MDYYGHPCPHCGEVFVQGDDIVVCPVCGTPHHRACWMKDKRCANEELHDSGFIWKKEDREPAQSADKNQAGGGAVICTACGASCPENSLSCPSCGKLLDENTDKGTAEPPVFPELDDRIFMRGVEEPPEEDLGGISVRDACLYTRTGAGRYIPKFARLKEKKTFFGWNWAAFIFTPYWFFFRKIYKAGFAFFGLLIALELAFSVPVNNAAGEIEKIVIEEYGVSESVSGPDAEYINALSTLISSAIEQKRTGSGSLTEEQLGSVISLFKVYGLYIGLIILLHAAGALSADFLYKKSMLSRVGGIKSRFTDARSYRFALLRSGGTSLMLGFSSYFLLGVIQMVFETLRQ